MLTFILEKGTWNGYNK